MTATKTIDQNARRELCYRILAGDRQAVAELAVLYRNAGYAALARMIEATDGKTHARAVIG